MKNLKRIISITVIAFFIFLVIPQFTSKVYADEAGALSVSSYNDTDSLDYVAQQLASTLAGSGIVVQNARFIGNRKAAGIFSGGAGIIGFDEGIILSTGMASDVVGPNNVGNKTTDWSTVNGGISDGDLDLNSINPENPVQTYDAVVLEFEFKTNSNKISFQYVFSSEEYNEYANSNFNDVFALYINGENKALIPNTNIPVSINNINNGDGSEDAVTGKPHNPGYFYDNTGSTSNPQKNTQMDGLTVAFSVDADVKPGDTNTIKLAIADVCDGALDSNVFIKAKSLNNRPAQPGTISISNRNEYDISFNRTGGGDGYISATYTALDVSGNQLDKYGNTIPAGTGTGKIEFNDGVSSATITVPTNTASVKLTNPTGGAAIEVGLYTGVAIDSITNLAVPAPALNGGLSFSDPSGTSNNGKTQITLGAPSVPGNTFKYIISSDNSAVSAPTVGYGASTWTVVVNGDLITVSNGKHIGVAEVDGTGHVVQFSDSVAVVADEYTVSYTSGANGNITGATSQTVTHGSSGTAVTAVADPGYHFVNWSDELTTPSRTDTNITGSINVTANFALNEYTITYAAGAHGNVSGISETVVYNGHPTSIPTVTPDTGYSFVYWSSNGGVTQLTNGQLAAQAITGDITYTAYYTINSYPVNFNVDGGSAIPGQSVSYGDKVTKPSDSTKTGYKFAGWYTNNTFTAAYDFNAAITANTTIYAKWTYILHDININDLSSWNSVSNYMIDSDIDAGGGGYELVKFYVSNDLNYLYFRWDIQLSGQNVTDLKSTNLGASLSASADGSTADAMVWLLFNSQGSITATLERLTGTVSNIPIAGTEVVKFNTGTEDARVSVVTRVPFNSFSNIGLGSTINPSKVFPLWCQTNASQQTTANIKDRIPNTGYFTYDASNGTAVVIGSSASNAKDILTFSVPGQVGNSAINSTNGTVAITVPLGTDLNNLVAAFTLSDKAKGTTVNGIMQTSSVTVNNFSSPVTYTVMAEDGTTKNWIVNVTASNVTLAPILNGGLSFNDPTGISNNGKTKITLGTPSVPGNTFKYIISSDNNAVPTPMIGYDASSWVTVTNGDLITVSNGKHIGVAEVDGTGHVVQFSDAIAVVTDEYTVSYTSGANGSITGTTSQTVTHGSNGTAVTAVADPGYHFVNWSDGSTTPSRTDTNVTGSINVTANFALNEYTVTYATGAHGNVSGTSETVVYNGHPTSIPTVTPDTGYTFAYWSSDGGITQFTNEQLAVQNITGDITYTAYYSINSYAVTFNSQEGSAVASINENYNITITRPADPTKTGYTFAGWYKEPACSNVWNFATDKVIGNITLYAKWTTNTYTITYDAEGGVVSPAIQTKLFGSTYGKGADGTTDEAMPTPIKTGYTFSGWYDDDNGAGNLLTNATSVTNASNHTLYAKWNINSYTVNFSVDGGSVVSSQSINYGDKAVKPADPTKAGYAFNGWYKESSLINLFDFNAETITANATIYAKWTYIPPVDTHPTTVTGSVIDGTTGDQVSNIEATVTTSGNGTSTISMDAAQTVVLKEPDGNTSQISDISKVTITTEAGAPVTITADGTIKVENLAKGTDSKFNITYDLGNGQKITIGTMDIKIDDSGNVSLTTTLIDPYGIITDKVTGKPVEGVGLTLYYADTDRNKTAGKIPDTVVLLPIIDGFKPNDNKNPQVTDSSGAYGFMVFPNTDYYIVAEKEGFFKYTSPTISVEKELVKWDFDIRTTKVPESPAITPLASGATNNKTPEISGTGEAGDTVTIYDYGTLIGTTVVGQDGSWSFTPSAPLKDGEHLISAKQTNKADNTSSLSGTISLTVDTVPSEVPIIVSPVSGMTNKNTPVISGTGEVGATVTVYDNGTSIGTTVVGQDGTWSFTPGTPLSDGIHQITVKQADGAGNISDSSSTLNLTIKTGTERISGQDRIDTALEIAKASFTGTVSNVVLATSENYPDALAGSVLAYKLNAPILLVGSSDMDQEKVLSYMKGNLDPKGNVYILGGTGAVSGKMETKVNDAGFKNIKRLGGADRYETAVKIAEAEGVKEWTPVVIVSGENYPDALSISSTAAVKQYPILLVTKDGIPDCVRGEISKIKPEKIYIIGLEGVVGMVVENQAAQTLSMDKSNIVRVGGKDRFETSLEAAKQFSLPGDIVCVATGNDFPDALAGSIYAAQYDAPIILADQSLTDDVMTYLKGRKIYGGAIFGGEGAVNRKIEEQLSQLTKQ